VAAWTDLELETMASEDEPELASERSDGSLREPVTIWMVRVGDDVFVRSVKGPEGPWFRGTRTVRRGRARAGDVERNVAFEDADRSRGEAIDGAYRDKYRRYASDIVGSVLTEQAKASTTRLVPA
jgi:hypothetical protein